MNYDYDLIVIGGGAAGLTSAGIGASLGAKTAMIEAHRLGGDCTWTGCIPSKALLHIAKIIHNAKKTEQFINGSSIGNLDFSKVRAEVHRIREEVYHDADRPEIFTDMGIDVIEGFASFLTPKQLEVTKEDGSVLMLSSKKFIIATGSKARVFPIEGLDTINFLTNESLFELDVLPENLGILGGGPIGMEMAQAFRRLGAKVSVIEMADHIMPRDHPELTDILKDLITSEGVNIYTNTKLIKASKINNNILLTLESNDEVREIKVSHLLVATGRKPNIEKLNLDKAGVKFTANGIDVNDACRTNVKHIYAAGDVTGRYAFTHMAEHMAKVASTNALLRLHQKMDLKHIPWVTFTDPELAHVGMMESDLKKQGQSYKLYRFPYKKVDRALAENAPDGWIRVYAKPLSGKILGADVIGVSAGEIISEYALAMKNGLSLKQIADTIHPYPTYGLAARRGADQWYVQNQRPWITKIIKKIFGYTGAVQEYNPDKIL
jgi:pyruvate/2-oxoglutarate dehydrogenase complex dihydrolipoamide dehydrogenase (E3) component